MPSASGSHVENTRCVFDSVPFRVSFVIDLGLAETAFFRLENTLEVFVGSFGSIHVSEFARRSYQNEFRMQRSAMSNRAGDLYFSFFFFVSSNNIAFGPAGSCTIRLLN